MSFTQVGSCPKCGAPIYAPSLWMSVTPPPSTPSCGCNPQAQSYVTTNTVKVKTRADFNDSIEFQRGLAEMQREEINKLQSQLAIARDALEFIDKYIAENLHKFEGPIYDIHIPAREALKKLDEP